MERCEIRTHSCRIILGTMLMFVLLLLCAGQAHAETEDFGTYGDNITWTLDDEGTLTISGSGEIEERGTADGYPWYAHKEKIKRLVVEEGITHIRRNAFSDEGKLESVKLPRSLKEIHHCVFRECSNLKEITIPPRVTWIAWTAFEKCEALETVRLLCTSWQRNNPYSTGYTPESSSLFGFAGTIYYPSNDDLWSEKNRNFWAGSATWVASDPVERDVITQGSLGGNVSWTYDEAGTLTVSGSGEIRDFTKDEALPWKGFDRNIRKLVVEEGITRVGEYAFYSVSPEKVSLPSSLKTIGNGAFENCWLETINIPSSVTEIGAGAFSGCRYLENIELPGGLEQIEDQLFSGCWKLERVEIPGGVKEIGAYAFNGCSDLKEISLPDNLTVLGDGALANCSSLKEINLPDSMKVLGDGALSGCRSLRTIILPESLEEIGTNAFGSCKLISEIIIPRNVRSIGVGVFFGCSNLEVVRLLCSPFSREYTYTEGSPLREYTGKVYYPSNEELWDEENRKSWSESVTWVASDPISWGIVDQGDLNSNIHWVFDDGGTLTVSGNGPIDQYETAEEYPWYEYQTDITKLVIMKGITEIGDKAFGSAEEKTYPEIYQSLYMIKMDDSVERIGDHAFQDAGFQKITLSQNLKSIGEGAFSRSRIQTMELPENVKSIGASAFAHCGVLKHIDIPEEMTNIGSYAFLYCTSMNSISLPAKLKKIEKGTFAGSGLQSIEIPERVTEIDESAFSNCKSLSQVKFPEGLERIGYLAFQRDDGLAEIRIPKNVKEIDKDAFSWCSNLKTITIDTYDHWCRIKFPNHWEGQTVWIFSAPLLNAGNRLIAEEETGSVKLSEGITQIPAYTFRGNDKLTSVELPKSLEQVGADAFDGCSGLKEVEVKNLASWCNTAFETAGSNPLNAASDAVLQIGGGTGTKVTLAEGIKQVPDRTFAGWDMLSEVTLPESLEKIGAGAFLGCDGIKTVNAASMGSWLRTAFATESSSPLNGGAQLRVKSGDTYNAVTELEIDRTVGSIPPYAFSGTKTLKTAVIPEGVTQIGAGAFASCSGLTEVSLPETVTALEEKTFSGCKELKKILIPQSITRIEYDAFSGCADDLIIYGYEGSEAENYAKARGITFLPYTEYDAIRAGKLSDNIKWTLSGGTTLTIEGSGSTPDYAEGKSPFAAFAGQVSTVKLKGVSGLGEYLLQDFKQLKRIDVGLETKLNQIDPSALSGCGEVEIRCYGNCYDAVSAIVSAAPELSGITVTKLSGSSAGNVTWTYNEDTGTILLTSNGADGFGETFTESPFAELKAKRVQFSDAFSCSDIPANLFKDCTTISEVQLPQQVKTIGDGAFQGCTNLQTLSWYGDIEQLGEGAFQGCASLKEIRLSGSVTMDDKGKEIGEESAAIPEKVRQIPASCFSGCSALRAVDWYEDPEETAEAGSIGAEAFMNCSALGDISIPDHVGAIGDRAFSGCENLTDREFSENLQEIGAKAFYGCTRMREMRFDGDLRTIGTKAIGYYKNNNKDEVQQGLRVVAPEDASNIKNYCSANDIGFVTTSGIIDGDPDQKVYVSITSSVTVKKGRSKSVKYSTNGKVKKVTSSGGGGIVSVTRSGSKIKFRGLRAGNTTVHLKFKMKGAGSISKTVYVKVKKSSASLGDGEAQNITVKQRSLTFASDAEGPQKISVSGVQTSLQASLSKAGIVKVSTNGTNTVTVTPLRSGQVDLTLQAAEDDVFLASGKVTIRITVKARPKTVTARAKKLSKKKAKVTWKKISGATSYQVQVATKKNFKGKKTYTVKAGKANTLKKTVKLKKGKKNYIRVRYLCKGKYSKWSRILTVKK